MMPVSKQKGSRVDASRSLRTVASSSSWQASLCRRSSSYFNISHVTDSIPQSGWISWIELEQVQPMMINHGDVAVSDDSPRSACDEVSLDDYHNYS